MKSLLYPFKMCYLLYLWWTDYHSSLSFREYVSARDEVARKLKRKTPHE